MDKKHENTKAEKLNKTNPKASPDRNIERHGDAGFGYGMRPVKKAKTENEEKIIKLYPETTENDKHRKIEKKLKKERAKKQGIRAAIGLGLAFVLAIVLLFMTPLFNIKEIRFYGNEKVTKDAINEKVGYLIGKNLFGTSISEVEGEMRKIPQISEVGVKKATFPARLEIEIVESLPAGYVLCGKKTLIINSDLKIIDDAGVFDKELLPSISGVSVSEYELNSTLNIKSAEKKAVLSELLKSFEAVGLTESVKYLSIDDLTAITFNYDNRLDVVCGSPLQLDRKIKLFSESIQTSVFDENSIGTIDLSVPGKAEYKP